ncbi:putative ATP-dependent RNA helicase Dbp21E2 [Lasioglossum baleicum]|uniref:putative ATP-dependent RNA helicase Dbp21E2 n=1 Tax=Lasioglossum baleicum TaxID=434251 RepID=UPI003FCD614A
MLFRFCNLCCNSANSPFVKLSRRYAKAVAEASINEEQLHDSSPKTKKDLPKGKVKIIECKRKEFNFYKGMAYKKKETIPLASQRWDHRKSRGDYFHIYPFYEDNIEENDEESPTFDDLPLNAAVHNQLESFDIKKPLEIQQLGIPKVLSGNHTLLTAETGCGKTLAYLLPLMSQILQWKSVISNPMNCPFAVIVAPTRELAVQIGIESIKWCKTLGISVKMLTGGRTKQKMLDPPLDRVDILVGSFGVISKLFTVGVYKKDLIRCMVLDEVDALFHSTFEESLKVFLQKLPIGYHQLSNDEFPETVQLILASATVPSRLENVLGNIINVDSLDHVTTGKLHRILVPQKFVRTSPNEKPALLLKYIKPKVARKESVIVFSNSNTTSYWMKLFLTECGVPTTNLHGSMPLQVRIGKYGEFINGHTYVLSTTNAGSRGLDTVMVNHILNYDFPLDTASYIHRCGRTGRVGTIGNCQVTNFISRSREITLTQKIEWATRRMKPIPIVDLEHSEPADVEEEILPEVEYEEQIIENLENAQDIPY